MAMTTVFAPWKIANPRRPLDLTGARAPAFDVEASGIQQSL
jgi:hypothetical protein